MKRVILIVAGLLLAALVAFLALPPASVANPSLVQLIPPLVFYLAKLGGLLLALAIWEIARSKMRLRAILPQLILAVGLLLFTLASLILKHIQSGA